MTGLLSIVSMMTILSAKVCSDCLVNYNVGLFELYNWQIYISQGIVCIGILLIYDIVTVSDSISSIDG